MDPPVEIIMSRDDVPIEITSPSQRPKTDCWCPVIIGSIVIAVILVLALLLTQL